MSDNTPDGTTPVPPAPGYGTTPPAYGATPPGYAAAPTAPAYGTPQGYPAAPYPQAPYGGYPMQPKLNTLAVVSLISSLVGALMIVPVIGQIVGIITGHLSLGQLKTNGERGRGLALAGTIVGWATLGLAILGIVAFFAVMLPLIIREGAVTGS